VAKAKATAKAKMAIARAMEMASVETTAMPTGIAKATRKDKAKLKDRGMAR